MSKLYSIGLMNQLGNALEKANFTCDDVTKLTQSKDLQDIKDFLLGNALISHHDINTEVPLYSAVGELIVEKDSGFGIWRWDASSIELFDKGSSIRNIRLEVKNQKWLTGGILDYLLKHTELIPENWKGKLVVFLGTTYNMSNYHQYCRFIVWTGDKWREDNFSYDYVFPREGYPVVFPRIIS